MKRLAAALLLTGCAAAEPSLTKDTATSLAPYSGGLTVEGTGGMEIGFGRDYTGAMAALTKLLGQPAAQSNGPGCTMVLWRTGLQTHFTGQTFTGWRIADQQQGRLC